MADPPPDSPESRYQAVHIRSRNTIERALGVWKFLRQDAEPPPVIITEHLRRQKTDVANQADTLFGSRCRMRLITRAITSPNE
ncbi:hypothetical protein MRX96_050542 [Rhipicephalus microplus]